MSIISRWKAPTPEFFKKVIRISLVIAAGAAALLAADTIGKAVLPNFEYTLLPVVKTICKNVFVAGIVAAAVAKAAKIDNGDTPKNTGT